MFLRLKKRTKFRKEIQPIESRENENVFANVINEMMNDMLHDQEMDQLIDNLHDQAGGIFNQIVTSNQEPPSTEMIYKDLPIPDFEEEGVREQPIYVQNLKELTGNEDDDLTRKELFLDSNF